MADQALIVGCDAYPNLPGGDLRGAVADALAVRDWLLSRQGAGVPESRLTFLASSSAAGAQADPRIVAGPAARPAFAQAVAKLVRCPDAQERDRLYVYLAGHGCRTDPGNPVLAQDAFAFTDFCTDDPPSACMGVQDLVLRLRQSRFGIVVVILDACRNFPFRDPFRLGGLGLDPQPPRDRPYEPRLFLLQATLPGRVAQGRLAKGTTGVVRGDFTATLLDGLGGAGTAKNYDETADRPYTVRWSSLTSFLEDAVPEQSPRGASEGDLVLASFPDGYFDSVRLTVEVDPREFRKASDLRIRVRYADPTAADDPEIELPGPVPVEFGVPPRRHRVVAQAGGTWGRSTLDVYADARVVVPMRTVEVGLAPTYREPWVVRDGKLTPVGAVMIESDDPTAVVQVRHISGRTELSGVGSVAGRLAAGTHTAALVDGDGRHHLQPIDVDAREVTKLAMAAPVPSGLPGEFGPGRRYLRRDLRWASNAAALAWTVSHSQADRRFAVAIAGTGPRPLGSALAHTWAGTTEVTLRETASGSRPWWAFILPNVISSLDEASWFTFFLGDHTLTVPGLPGASTTMVLGSERLVVALLDAGVLDSPLQLALLDRGQSLLGAGERELAADVLAGLRESPGRAGYAAAVLRRAARGQAAGHGLAAAVAAADAPGLLGTGPWAVFIDRSERRPPPIGDVPR